MSERIVVINPNSSVDVTSGIDAAMAPLRFADGPAIDCLTLAEGPLGIETQRHVDSVVGPLCELIEREDNGADAFVVACFSDPGLHSAREATARPVMGISESSITTALTLGERFGIIAILPAGVARHQRYIRQMGLEGRMAGIRVEEREEMYERIAGKIAIESLRPSYLIFGTGFSKPPLTIACKRIIDIMVSLAGLILSAPICLLGVLAIRLDSKGPIFFRQPRVGQEGATFNVLKFRTMRVDAEARSGPVWAQINDDRVTRVGRLLRLTRIDEIPQMINVLAGQMSFVGPRPERPFFVKELSREIPFYPLRLAVKPGITGWAQVNHHYGASVDDAVEKLRFDLYYLKNMSILFDINIILRTVGVVIFGKGAR